jgi:hypothetical protein
MTKHASLEDRTRLEHMIDLTVQSHRTRSMPRRTVQQTKEKLEAKEKLASVKQEILLTELHNMDEERRSLAELHLLNGRTCK